MINDINGNGRQEIAVLDSTRVVTIKDVKNNSTVLKTIGFLDSTYIPLSVTSKPDQNNNRVEEITVVGSSKLTPGIVKAETRDISTKVVISWDKF